MRRKYFLKHFIEGKIEVGIEMIGRRRRRRRKQLIDDLQEKIEYCKLKEKVLNQYVK